MMNHSSNFNRLKLEIAKILSKTEFKLENAHSLDTLKWVKEIDTNANEYLQIAALAHDIDRGVSPRIIRETNEEYSDYKKRHAKRSSQLIADLMLKYNYPKNLINKTSHLVKNHEVGGDTETTILMDADSISFFSCNLEWYYKYKGLEETKNKIMFMYKRATPRAKQIIKEIKIKNKILYNLCQEVFKN
jgi:hypothetical protein